MGGPDGSPLSRRQFLHATGLALGGCLAGPVARAGDPPGLQPAGHRPLTVQDLPKGSAPVALPLPHFPDRLHAFVWRNWSLVPLERMARVVEAKPAELRALGMALGLGQPPRITADQQRRSFLTVIKRNWHLLPYEQLLTLLNWTPDQLAYTLREDDFLYIKLGNLKPQAPALRYGPPDAPARQRAAAIARIVRAEFPGGLASAGEPLFQFVQDLSAPAPRRVPGLPPAPPSRFTPRFCYSYFALYGDPLLETETDPYPEGYLARLASSGVDGVWLQGVLHKLGPFPWDESLSRHHEQRLRNLRTLAVRARRHGVGLWLYLNEPRAMPLAFFDAHPGLKGVVEGDYAALCTSQPEVQAFLKGAVTGICRAVPELAGFFTITASENLSNCWSHQAGAKCPRCGARSPGAVIAEVNGLIQEGIRQSGAPARLIAWDWGWNDAWAEEIVARLPAEAALMSVSEWSLPLERGGVKSTVGEYSISAVGPGPRAQRHWELARKRGLKTIAKIQAGNSWELSAVPYIPALENVARHAANLRTARLDGLMLGWTLGGYPSPNLEVVAELAAGEATPEQALLTVAARRVGVALAPALLEAWRVCSRAFCEFPFHPGLVYQAPLQNGPSNLLYEKPTGYAATMVGFPYDDLKGWRAVYPPEIFVAQLEKVADGFDQAVESLPQASPNLGPGASAGAPTLERERGVIEAAALHFRSVANQARFVLARQSLAANPGEPHAAELKGTIIRLLHQEIGLARRLHRLQTHDSRLGFEASNQYFYVPLDLAEKVVNCRYLLDQFQPAPSRGDSRRVKLPFAEVPVECPGSCFHHEITVFA